MLQMEILTYEPGAFDLIEMSGQTVFLNVTPEQETFGFDSETGEIIQ